MSIPRANLHWAHVDCQRQTHEVNVGGQHRAHVGPTYHRYLGFAAFAELKLGKAPNLHEFYVF